MPEIEYFYAAHSAFAYLGSARLMAIASAAKRRISHKPMDLRKVIATNGIALPGPRPTHHVQYFFGREIDRWAELRQAPVLGRRPSHHDNDMTLPNCMLIAGQDQGIEIDGLAHAMLEAHWRDDADLADRETLTRIGDQLGLDPAPLLETALSPEVQATYAQNTAEAIERSVFGSPTYFVDGDMFYGQDHLELVERALQRPFAGTWPLP
jgi:2-hydroxychromene-2-carboxylate isomerase